MKQFKILAHTADLRLQIFGHTEEELFQNAVSALASILGGEEIIKTKKSPAGFEKIKAEAPDINSLLINFLNEVLTQSQINKKIYLRAKFLKFSPKNLEAQIFGFETGEFKKDVKAVTYHRAEISFNKRGIFEITVTLDI